MITILCVTHFKLPKAWRQDLDFRKRLRWNNSYYAPFLPFAICVYNVLCFTCNCNLYFRWHHLATLYIIVMSVQYWTFSVLFFVCPLNIQWVLGIAMTIVREANVLILTSICSRVASNKVVAILVFFCLNVSST